MESFLQYSKSNVVPLTPGVGSQIGLVFQKAAAAPDFKKGAVVTLTSDGTIKECTGTDIPLGYVLTKNPYDEGGYTVTLFHGTGKMGVSAAALAPGDLLTATGVTSEGYTTYATTGTYVVGICLAGAAGANEPIEVLLYNSPHKR